MILTSTSENNGLAILDQQDLRVYSVGISSGCIAEVRMAKSNSDRQIIASTLDQQGAKFAQKLIDEEQLSEQIEVRIENVAEPLPYEDEKFDFIYARLVLHYLTTDQLDGALSELFRVLKKGGKFFVVVRSIQCPNAKQPSNLYNQKTCMTTYVSSGGTAFQRYFHTESSISEALKASGFTIDAVNAYEEQLCSDFERTTLSPSLDHLIELLARK